MPQMSINIIAQKSIGVTRAPPHNIRTAQKKPPMQENKNYATNWHRNSSGVSLVFV